MAFKNIEDWLRIYKTLPPNDLESFGKYIRQDFELLAEFNNLLINLSDPMSSEIVDPVFHQLFNFYRSNITELKHFSIELLPKVIETYLVYYYTEPQHLPACIGAFILGIYNLTVADKMPVISKDAYNLHKPSIYHDPPPISITLNKYNNNNTNNYNNNDGNTNNDSPTVGFKKFESINAYNRSEVLSHVLEVYNWHISSMSIDSQKALCHLCSRLCRMGFKNLVERTSPKHQPAATSNNNNNTKNKKFPCNTSNSATIKQRLNNSNKNNNVDTTIPPLTANDDDEGEYGSGGGTQASNASAINKLHLASSDITFPTTSKHNHTRAYSSDPARDLSSTHPSKSPKYHSFNHSSTYYFAHSFSSSSVFNAIPQAVQPFANPSLKFHTSEVPKVVDDFDNNELCVKIPFTAPLLLELLKGIYFLIFNGLSYLGLQSLEDCHVRACYELNPQVLLVTNAILNSVQQMAAGTKTTFHKDNRQYQHLIPLSPSLSLPSIISLSKDAITSASFKTKKLPEDIEVRDHNDLHQLEHQMGNISLSTSENLDLSAVITPAQETPSDSDKNPFSRIPIISLIKNKEKSFRNMQQRSKEGSGKDGGSKEAKEAAKETKDGGGGEMSSLFGGLGHKKNSLSTKSNSEHNMAPFKFNQQVSNTDHEAGLNADDGEDTKHSTTAPLPEVAFKSRFIKSLHINKQRFHKANNNKNSKNAVTSSNNNNNNSNNNMSNIDDNVINGYTLSDWSMEGRKNYAWSMNEKDYEDEDEDEDGNEDETDSQVNTKL